MCVCRGGVRGMRMCGGEGEGVGGGGRGCEGNENVWGGG